MTKLQKKHPPGGQAGWAKKPEILRQLQLERDKSTAVALALQGRVMHAKGQPPTTEQVKAALVQERRDALEEVARFDAKQQTVASRDVFEFARRRYEAALAGEKPVLQPIDGGRRE